MSHPRRRLSRGSAVLAVLAVASIGALSVSAAVAANPQTLKWTFDHDFDGWHPGGAGPRNSTDWGFATHSSVGGGVVVLDGRGNPSRPNSWIFRTVDLPASATHLSFDVSAELIAGSSSSVRVRIEAGGTSTALRWATVRNSTNHLSFVTRSIDISRWAGQTVTIDIEQNDNTPAGSIGFDKEIYVDNVKIEVTPRPTPTPSLCDFGGIVRDGDLVTDGHDNSLVGVPVELFSNGTPIAGPAVTGSDGHYCLNAAGATPGDYQVRASLIDGEHTPPIYVTTHAGSPEPVSLAKAVTAEDFGRQDFDITFSATADRPWLADVANIHWQSGRFVDWLLDRLVLDPAKLAGLTIETGASRGTQYRTSAKTVFISERDTPFASRQDATTMCPENCEWHEIGHHVAERLAIAPDSTCRGFVNHGGWTNSSTCDSLAEGFPSFLATLASLDIDAGRGAGYATPAYAVFGSLEANGYRPWSQDGNLEREDFAVAQLLWDLADDTPSETTGVDFYVGPPVIGVAVLHVPTADMVTLGGIRFVQLLALEKPNTVADLYDDLLADPAVPAALKVADVDLDGDGTADLSPLAQVFVEHGFNPAELIGGWKLGDPIALTQPGSTNLVVRRQLESIPGSAVRFRNSSSAAVTFSMDIAYPSTTLHFDVDVAASSDRIVEIELPPYWSGRLEADGSLPACATPDASLVSMTLSAPGTASRTLSSCEYLHLVAAATDGAALTFGALAPAASSDVATVGTQAAETSPLIPALAVLGAFLVVAAGFIVARRRRRAA